MASPSKSKFSHLPLSTSGPVDCALHGTALLNTPYFNRGSAHTPDERREFELTGLLPQSVQTLEQQAKRAYEQYSSRPNDLSKNTFLTSLKDQNLVLYFKLLTDHMKEMFSVVYTPTEGEAISNFSRLFRQPEGCFLNINDIDRIPHDLSLWGRPEDVDYIVVSDGEEILGIGDQGVGGVLISVAKLVLTTLCAGIHPNRTLPVVLDCGTNNEDLLNDELYLGLRERRVRGERYDKFVDKFVQSARELFPNAYIHFEDFGLTNARRILDTYRPKIPCFNDDIQGTGCVTLAAIMAGLHVSKRKLCDTKMVIFGAGTAGVGIADQVRDAIATEKGISKEEAAKQIWLIDRPGLLTTKTELNPGQKVFAKDASEWDGKETSLLSVVKEVQPEVLVGTSTVPGAFTEEIVKAMAAGTERPVILPLSNPTRLHEAVPADLLRWTDGRALVATGSPFAPVRGPWGPGGADVEVEPAECNNSVVFPGVGLGAVLSRAERLTDGMLVAAVRGVAALSPALMEQGQQDDDDNNSKSSEKDKVAAAAKPLLPGVEDARRVSVRVAREVIKAAVRDGVAATKDMPDEDEELDEWIREQMWEPVYRPLRRVGHAGASREARGELRVASKAAREEAGERR
ncbi:NAD-dependent malic enzyme [Xylariaceae sp. FL0804]|nr:NAD-dependent malic enzyme [Xylariaceae sp. FL0804]